MTAPPTSSPAQTIIATRYAGSRVVGSVSDEPTPAASGRTAIASRPATRATALFTPLAAPARWSGAAARAVVVNGATVADSPRPNTTMPGRTCVRYGVSGVT